MPASPRTSSRTSGSSTPRSTWSTSLASSSAVVVAYGSLAHGEGEAVALPGWRRAWGVAMDNAVALPGYKQYRDPATGEVPRVRVCFLDAVRDPTAVLRGRLVEVEDLEANDERERNYRRVAVLRGKAWLYTGLPDSRDRAAEALEAGDAVIARPYLEAVRAVFGADVPDPPCPIRDLVAEPVPE